MPFSEDGSATGTGLPKLVRAAEEPEVICSQPTEHRGFARLIPAATERRKRRFYGPR